MKSFFNTFKEEIITIILFMAGFFGLNFILQSIFPQSATFDFGSEVETIFYGVVRFIVVLAVSWLGIRVIFPNVFKFLKNEFYKGFNTLDIDKKYLYAIILFCVFVLASAISANAQEHKRAELMTNLIEQLDVREITTNSSPEIDRYLKHTGIYVNAPWCAAFVAWNLNKIGVDNPRSAWSPNYAMTADVIWRNKKPWNPDIKMGDVFTLYYNRLGRVGHVGFFIKKDRQGRIVTIEGNTNKKGSREGDRVAMKKRDIRKIYAISQYIK